MLIAGPTILNTATGGTPTPFTMLVPDLGQHQPFIYAHEIYGMKLPSGSTRTLLNETDGFREKYQVLVLNGEDIAIGNTINQTAIDYTLDGGECPKKGEEGSLRWAPSLSAILGTSVSIDSKFMNPNPPGLKARMKIDVGTVKSEPQERDIWQFRTVNTDKTGHTQMITGLVVHEFTVDLAPNEPLTLKRRAFNASSSAMENLVTLMPHKNLIEFTIGTTPPGTRLPGKGTKMDEDKHFKDLYAYAGKTSNLHPFRTAAFCKPSATSLVNCGPGRP